MACEDLFSSPDRKCPGQAGLVFRLENTGLSEAKNLNAIQIRDFVSSVLDRLLRLS